MYVETKCLFQVMYVKVSKFRRTIHVNILIGNNESLMIEVGS